MGPFPLLLLIAHSPSLSALPRTILTAPPQKEHAIFYKKKYLTWYNKSIFNWDQYLSQKERAYLKQLIEHGGRWLSPPPLPRKETFALGTGLVKNKKYYTLEVYIPDTIKRSLLLKEENPTFLRWSTLKDTLCFISLKGALYHHRCYEKNRKKLLFTYNEEIRSPSNLKGPLFGTLQGERAFTMHLREETGRFYYTKNPHYVLLPPALQKIVSLHALFVKLNLDKIEIWNEDGIVLIYP